MLLVHGDFDLSTPIENAEELMSVSKNAHLIRIAGGTHGAFDQIAEHDSNFRSLIVRFLDAKLEPGEQAFQSLDLPTTLDLPPLQFKAAQDR